MTSRDFLRLHPHCAYCSTPETLVKAVHRDHVVPIALRRRHHIDATDERFHVPACFACNILKLSFKFYPRGFDVSLLPGTGWKEWHGEPISQVFAK